MVDHYDCLSATQYCPFLPALKELIAQSQERSEGDAHSFAEAAARVVHESFKYKPGATHVHSSVEDSLATRSGVCQDFSHILLSMLRMRGLPARYVSGYLITSDALEAQASMEKVIGGQVSHAWVQVYIPETGWIGLDPTAGQFAEARHILVARDRDYGDVPPVRGVYKGHAGRVFRWTCWCGPRWITTVQNCCRKPRQPRHGVKRNRNNSNSSSKICSVYPEMARV